MKELPGVMPRELFCIYFPGVYFGIVHFKCLKRIAPKGRM